MAFQKVIQLELNEISIDIIKKLISRDKLPNFKHVLENFQYLKTTSTDVEYRYIEPWIQWITAHTGKVYNEHGVFYLGDVNKLTYPQIWESLAEKNISSVVFGCMNANQGKMKDKMFFS